jgi:hypothetical protein
MALTSAEKQQRYRERHLGVHGSKERIRLFVSVQTKAQLRRLARHYGYTITRIIEDLVKDADRAILDQLPTRQHSTYLDATCSAYLPASRQNPQKSRQAPGLRFAARLLCNHSRAGYAVELPA